MNGLGESETRRLLHRLNSTAGGSAWAEFIEAYSALIMHVVHQFDFSQDRTEDCFLFICEKLAEQRFRRLLAYSSGGRARFSTWLTSVVFNLCVDWHRKEFGRASLLPAITALPEFDQAVYRLCYQEGMSYEEGLNLLKAEFPGLERQQYSDARARVHRSLTPRQRWQAEVRKRRAAGGLGIDPDLLPAGAPGPDEDAHDQAERKALEAALATMDIDERLMLTLRFGQGLTLRQVANLMELGDPFRARRKIEKALTVLKRRLQLARREGQK